MSGGSFNYAYAKLQELEVDLDFWWGDVLDAAEAIEEEGYAEVANDVRSLHDRMIAIRKEIAEEAVPLSDVLKAIEWYRSGDWSKDQFADRAEGYLVEKASRLPNQA